MNQPSLERGADDQTFHDVMADADANGCGWPTAIEIPIDESWRSGFHLITLRAHDGPDGRRVAHTGFVVRAGAQRQRAVLVLATNTWNAYNTWGGKSLYTGGHQVSFRRPWARGMLDRPEVERDDRKSRPVHTGEEPDDGGFVFQEYRLPRNYPSAIGSTGWFTHARRFVEWAERDGRSFDLLASTDLDLHPDRLDGYDLVLGVGHDEYWSAGQRTAIERYVQRGGHYASFSGNTMFWQVRIKDGDRGTAMIGHKYAAHRDDPPHRFRKARPRRRHRRLRNRRLSDPTRRHEPSGAAPPGRSSGRAGNRGVDTRHQPGDGRLPEVGRGVRRPGRP
ncbi:MAG: hypothetical protein EBY52_00110 [Actinobacteria bacterium]|nr:hypothetical protein [Actinomycetota bacterium]